MGHIGVPKAFFGTTGRFSELRNFPIQYETSDHSIYIHLILGHTI